MFTEFWWLVFVNTVIYISISHLLHSLQSNLFEHHKRTHRKCKVVDAVDKARKYFIQFFSVRHFLIWLICRMARMMDIGGNQRIIGQPDRRFNEVEFTRELWRYVDFLFIKAIFQTNCLESCLDNTQLWSNIELERRATSWSFILCTRWSLNDTMIHS